MHRKADAVRREYDRLASSYDIRWRAYVLRTLSAVVEGVEIQGHERVLDMACGTGELERRLLFEWPKLKMVGTDLSPEMLEQARAKPENRKAFWARAEPSHLPFDEAALNRLNRELLVRLGRAMLGAS